MSWSASAGGKRTATAILVLGLGFAFLVATAAAQNPHPRDEIFGGYSVLFPNGWEELNYKANTIPNAFDVSNTYYFCHICGLGWLLDGSGHFLGGTTPPNLLNGSTNSTGVGYALTGLQYKWHNDKLSPFVRGFVGAANISPDCCHGTEWRFAAGGGGGVDWNLSHSFSLRLIQADYIYSSYPHVFPSNHPTEWNSVRLAFGLVFNLGTNTSCNPAPAACTITVGSPTEVFAGEPVKFTVAGINFNPKDPLTYGWKATGGKVSSANTSATEVDTAALASGSYSVTTTVQDSKKTAIIATCGIPFIVKPPPPRPVAPTVQCIPTETLIKAGETATVRMVATNPDNRPLTHSWTTTAGQLSGRGDSSTVTPSNNQAGGTITVTGSVNDDRNLSASCLVKVTVPKLPPPCVDPEPWGECTFVKNPNFPSRIDNDCKDVLDKLALDIQGKPTGKLAIVGSTAAASKLATLGAQRAENAKYYLTTTGSTKVDGDRLDIRQGGASLDVLRFYYVPAGDLCANHSELGTPVDESKIKGQERGKLPGHNPKKAEAETAQ